MRNSLVFYYPGLTYNESAPYIVRLPPGSFTIECWGSRSTSDGYGAYTKGTLTINKSLDIYLYIGTYVATWRMNYTTYNGGGVADSNGGGATDVRLVPGNWDNFESLKSRIMVAASAGGRDCGDGVPGNGGSLAGQDATTHHPGKGGTQTSGGIGYVSGSFGKGGSYFAYNETARLDNPGGGGGGYYGGGTGQTYRSCAGGGGSSFISGYEGCDAITESSTESHIVHTGQSIHYSGIKFNETEMREGNTTMPLPNGTEGKGNYASGAVRISPFIDIRSDDARYRRKYYLLHLPEKRRPMFINYRLL